MNEKNIEAWSLKNSVDFYVAQRMRAKDLYPSEASMLLPLAPLSNSVLDVGCAAGNFSQIFKELNPKSRYVGVDTAEQMIETARKRFPDIEFHLTDGKKLPFQDNSFDLVLCTGVLLHNPDYLKMIADFFRIARKYVVIDLPRLTTTSHVYSLETSHMILKSRFPSGTDGISEASTRVPYVFVNVEKAIDDMLTMLGSALKGFACHGYYGEPDKSVALPVRPIIFTVASLIKAGPSFRYWMDLPPDAAGIAQKVFDLHHATKVDSVAALVSQ